MTALQRIDELTAPPVVGQFYLVPTVRDWWYDRMGIWPVLPPFHEDKEIIGYPYDHIHVDHRFLTTRQQIFAARVKSTVADAVDRTPISRYDSDAKRGLTLARPRPEIEWRRRPCTHAGKAAHLARTESSWFSKLESAYAACTLKPGLICPHRGAHLGSMPVDAEGNVVCPMHGLKWNVATGEMVCKSREAANA